MRLVVSSPKLRSTAMFCAAPGLGGQESGQAPGLKNEGVSPPGF